MADSRDTVEVKLGVNTAGAGQALQQFASLFQAKMAEMAKAPEQVNGKLKALALTMAAGFSVAAITRLITSSADAAGKLHDLAMQTGMTVESLSALGGVGKLSDVSLDTIAAASNRLSLALSKQDENSAGAAAALRALRIDYAAFVAMSPQDRMQAVAKAMAQFEDGAGKSAAAMALFGKQGAQLIPFFADLAEVEKLTGKVTAEQAEAGDRLGDNMTMLRSSGEAWKKTLSNALLPALADASSAVLAMFRETGGLNDQIKKLAADGSINRWARDAINALTYVLDVVTYLKRGIVTLAETLAAALAQATTLVGGIATAAQRLMAGDFSGAVDAVKSAYGQMTAIGADWWKDQKAQWASGSATLGEKLRDGLAKAAGGQKKDAREKLDFKNDSGDGGKGADDAAKLAASRQALLMAQQQAELALTVEHLKEAQAIYDDAYQQGAVSLRGYYDARLAIEQEGLRRAQDAKRAELAEAQKNADMPGIKEEARNRFLAQAAKLQGELNVLTAREAEAVRANIAAREQAELQLQVQLSTIRVQATAQAAQDQIAEERAALAQRRALNDISADEALAAEMALEQRAYAALMANLAARRAAITGSEAQQAVARAQLQAEGEAAERAHQARLTQITYAAEQQRRAATLQTQRGVQQSMQGMFQSLFSGTTKIGDALRTFAANVARTFEEMAAKKLTDKIFDVTGLNSALDRMVSAITGFIDDMVAQWIVGETTKTAATQAAEVAKTASVAAGASTRTATEATASATSKGFTMGDAIASIGAKAWQAAANVYAAISAIPVVGPFLAPAAAMAAGAVVLGFIGKVASSEGGEYRVGQDRLNIVHKDETILPAPFAQGLRQMIGTGGVSPLQAQVQQIAQAVARDTQQAASGRAETAGQRGGLTVNTEERANPVPGKLQSLLAGEPVARPIRWLLPADPAPGAIARSTGQGAEGGTVGRMAESVRQIAATGGTRREGDMHVTIQALDGASVQRFFRDNAPHVAAGLKRYSRDGGTTS